VLPAKFAQSSFPANLNLEVSSMRFWKALQLSVCSALLCAALGPSLRADTWDKKTIVTFGDAIEIPGQVLPAGTYVFKLANSSSNRHIVQIWNEDETQIFATILTIPEYRLDPAETTIFEFEERPGDSPMALRRWFYPGETIGDEFVYSQYR
jgi:hypothetical protein